MAAKGIFLIYTLEELTAIRDELAEQMKLGRSIVQYVGEGVTVSKTVLMGMSCARAHEELLYALQKKDPANYPPSSNFVSANLGGSRSR